MSQLPDKPLHLYVKVDKNGPKGRKFGYLRVKSDFSRVIWGHDISMKWKPPPKIFLKIGKPPPKILIQKWKPPPKNFDEK